MQTERRFNSANLTLAKQLLSSKYTAIAILLIISIGVYLNTLPNEFVYDDGFQVLNNPWIKDIRYIPDIILTNVWAFVGEGNLSNYYRPLMHIIYMIDYHIFGLKPWGFHLTNILFHAGVSVLVFIIASMLINQLRFSNLKFKTQNPKSQISNQKSEILSPAFIAALLFAAHPIHTEAVTWIGGIPELSFTLFYLLSFYLYIYPVRDKSLNGIQANGKWGKGVILSLFFFFLATLCKETALTLPLLMLVYDYSFRKDTLLPTGRQVSPFSPKTFYHLVKRYLPYLIISIIYFILRTYALGGFAPLKRHVQLSNYEYLINIFPIFTQYLEKLILPINMNAFYVFHPISSIFQLKGIIALILTLAFVFLVYIFRRHKVVFLSLLWIVIPLLPVLYIPVLGENTFTDRYLYLPSIGFVILVSLVIERIYQLKALRQSRRFGIVIIFILVILTGLYSVGTIKRNYIWRNNYSLWTDTVGKSPDSSMAHYNLGTVYFDKKLFDKAIEHYQTALKLKPEYPEAHNNLGIIYFRQDRLDDAIKEYTIALRLKPDYPEAHYNLGNIYLAQGRFDEAIKEYLIGLRLRPQDAKAHYNLGNAYFTLGKFDEAIEEYLIALRLNPDDAETHNALGNVYSKQRRLEDAIKEYMIVLKLKPNSPGTYYNLGLVYLEMGLKHKAEEEFKTALKLRPDFTPAREALKSVSNTP